MGTIDTALMVRHACVALLDANNRVAVVLIAIVLTRTESWV